MSELENDGHHHLSLFSENERYTCSSPFTLKPTETNVTLEVDFEDNCQDAEKPSETDFKISLKDIRRYTQEHSKVELNFKDIKQKNPVESKHISEGTLCEKSLKNELSCLEDGEVVETDETTVDLEEGEIKETPSEKTVEAYNCRYYQMGSCLYGKDCRFFHVSDKGLYSMFDLSVSAQKKVPHPSQFIIKQNGVSSPSVFEVKATSWDKDLKEAMDRVESKKKVALGREDLRMTIQSGSRTNEKHLSREFPPKNSLKRTYAGKTRGSSLNKRKTAYEISPVRSKSSARDSIDTRCSFIRSKTPRDMRWSPKSASCSCKSRSRSRSSSVLSSNRSSAASPKRGRRILSSSVTKNYRKKYSSSSKSPSRSYTTKTGSMRFKHRRREYSSHFKSSKISDCRSPVKILLPKRLERERRRLSRREIPRRVLPPKSQVASKSPSPYTKPRDKSRSDMSISPLSDQKGGCIEDFSAGYCSDRHVSDMSISPLSSPSRASCQIEVENYSESESKVENLAKSIIRKKSPNGEALILSAQQENNTLEISPNSSSNISNPTTGTWLKNNSLVVELGKFLRNFERNDSFKEGMKNVTKTKLKKTSEFVDRPSNHTEIKVKRKTNTIQSKLSRKEMLLKRLQEVNEAIKSKKVKK